MQKELDQFYTNSETVVKLHKRLKNEICKKINMKDIVWLEPSSGTGNFLYELQKIYKENFKYISFDIDPKISNNDFLVKKKDFLKVEKIDYLKKKKKLLLVILPLAKRVNWLLTL